jgi:hypothetical protein
LAQRRVGSAMRWQFELNGLDPVGLAGS